MDNKITKNPKIPAYQKTPEGIMYFINHFHKHNISYILFKCDHIFGGMNKNLDILFETDIDYKKAAYILEQHNFVIQLSEKVEKFKTMYVGLYKNNPSHPLSIHLHREVAWHGMKALDKEPLFQRKQTITQLIIIPSIEDSILLITLLKPFLQLFFSSWFRIYSLLIFMSSIWLRYIFSFSVILKFSNKAWAVWMRMLSSMLGIIINCVMVCFR